MTSVLQITPEKQAEIDAAVAYAEAHPLPWSVLRHGVTKDVREVKLADRPPGFERPASEHVLIPYGYRAAISVEEQPAGFLHHLSVSVDRPGKVPSMAAVRMIAEAFGIKAWIKIWLEEFDPGHHAVNVLELYKPRAELST